MQRGGPQADAISTSCTRVADMHSTLQRAPEGDAVSTSCLLEWFDFTQGGGGYAQHSAAWTAGGCHGPPLAYFFL